MKETTSLYGGEVLLTYTDKPHGYFVEDGAFKSRVPGSTTILGVINKETIAPWYAKEAVKALGWYEREIWTPKQYIPVEKEEFETGQNRLVILKSQLDKMTPDEYWEALKQAKGAASRSKDESANTGTMVHALIEQYIKGTLDITKAKELPEKVYNGMQAFLQFVNEHHVQFLGAEERLYSRLHRIAGTRDFRAVIDGKLSIGDIKTSNFFSPDMFMQTGSYQLMDEEEHPDTRYDQNVIVRCGKDGTLEVKIQPREEVLKDIEAFLAAKTLYNRKQETKKLFA